VREEIRRIQEAMEREGYVTDRGVATAVHLATTLGKPLLVEGHPGVGKTEIAKVLATVLQGDLIRLQCYEGLDATTALYEWNYPKQLLHIRLLQDGGESVAAREADIFSERFLLRRPLLQAITHHGRPPVLLIDEVDRADEEFEAFLLEVLSDFQVTIPEIGTVRAEARPAVVLTSNRARDLSDALRRRCLYPDPGHRRAPGQGSHCLHPLPETDEARQGAGGGRIARLGAGAGDAPCLPAGRGAGARNAGVLLEGRGGPPDGHRPPRRR